MSKLDRYAKALLAAVIAALGVLWTASGDNQITLTEWIQTISAGLGALAVVWGVPNAAAKLTPSAPVTTRTQPLDMTWTGGGTGQTYPPAGTDTVTASAANPSQVWFNSDGRQGDDPGQLARAV
jgi:hypothetical protein